MRNPKPSGRWGKYLIGNRGTKSMPGLKMDGTFSPEAKRDLKREAHRAHRRMRLEELFGLKRAGAGGGLREIDELEREIPEPFWTDGQKPITDVMVCFSGFLTDKDLTQIRNILDDAFREFLCLDVASTRYT